MSISRMSPRDCLSLLASHLAAERYSCGVARNYLAAVKRFVEYAEKVDLGIETVKLPDVERYLSTLQLFRKLRSRPRRSAKWVRQLHRSAIHMLLHVLDSQRPASVSHVTERELFHHRLVTEYDHWMDNVRGLAGETRKDRCSAALLFMKWLAERGDKETLAEITVADIDAYVQSRSVGLRRTTVKGVTVNLRSFLRHLDFAGRTVRDLSAAVIGPTLYAFEGIPSALRSADVTKVLQVTRRDHTPIGRRDYAILALLSFHGLRAGEITSLRLEDIDWKRGRLRVRHLSQNSHSNRSGFTGALTERHFRGQIESLRTTANTSR
jgi:integrase/recombinase XerD